MSQAPPALKRSKRGSQAKFTIATRFIGCEGGLRRALFHSAAWRIEYRQLMREEGKMSNLAIDGTRLWSTICETAQIGGTAKGGINRLTLTEEDRQVRDWFKRACEAVGCTIEVDGVGTMFARRAGRDNTLAPICIGSHLDTQPTGGKFDGVLGVLAGLEILRTLHDADYVTNAPIEVVNWTNEEGSRFAPAMLASGAFAGAFAIGDVLARADRNGTRFGDALDRIGYRGNAPVGGRRMSAMFELHIEQGPILEREGAMIGVVTGVQGMRWYDLTIIGRDSHSGTTPMAMRRDALVGAAKAIEIVQSLALKHGPLAVATVGSIEVRPNSRNVVPGEVLLGIDHRHPEEATLARMENELTHALAREIEPSRLVTKLERVWDFSPVHFDDTLVSHVRQAAERLGFKHRDIVSGAGHDAAYIARVAPTTMVFVPCRDGVSHNEEEDTTQEQCAAGAAVVLEAVLAFDATIEPGTN